MAGIRRGCACVGGILVLVVSRSRFPLWQTEIKSMSPAVAPVHIRDSSALLTSFDEPSVRQESNESDEDK
jgi:hypothetical protein